VREQRTTDWRFFCARGAVEGHHAEPLVRDPYAAAFVKAAAGQLPGPMAVTPEEAEADPDFPWSVVAHYVAVLSRFFGVLSPRRPRRRCRP
jgi:O-methyltransferase involved in polyketide biosynthesis